ILSTTNYVFDIFGLEYLLPLLNGSFIDIVNIKKFLNKSCSIKLTQYDYIQLTPSKIELLFSQISFDKTFGSHKLTLLIGGEPLTMNHIRPILDYELKNNNISFEIINLYGPTESTIWSTMFLVNNNTITIGRPLTNETVYVLGSDLKPIPVCAVGELYIGGEGVARGYLNQPKLNKERFITNPFQIEKEKQFNRNAKIYRTGDLVRYLPDGNLEYIGRNDLQVKIRGYRVELGEIENVLRSSPKIEHCVVLSKKASGSKLYGNTYLVAYYVANKVLDDSDLLAYMSQKLPDYMLPNVFIRIERLPLTTNGKLDRNALPNSEPEEKNVYVAPRDELEQKICMIYAEVLELPFNQVGITDNFFRLGGNSILAIRLANKLSIDLKINLTVAMLLKSRNISAMLGYMRNNSMETVTIPKTTISKNLYYPLSFAQERLWFIDRYENGSSAYNILLVVEINNKVDLTILKQSIGSIDKRHEVLHSLIKADDFGNSYQVVCNFKKRPLIFDEQTVSSKLKLNQLINQSVNHVYNLNEEYPIKISIFSKKLTKSKKNYLCIVVHHIAFDEWSIDIFLNELQSYYDYSYKLKSDEKAILNLPELSIQYKDYATWQKSYVNDDFLKEQLKYWFKKLDGYQTLHLPLDKYRPQYVSYAGDDVHFILNEVTSNKLRGLAKSLGVSLYSVLLSGYYILLSSYSNQDDIIIGVPVANRHYKQLEHLIGFFVNSLALRSKIDKDYLLIDYIKMVGSEIVEAQLHQDLPFEKLVTELNILQDTTRHPIFQVMFTMQNFESTVSKHNQLFKLYQNYEYKIAKFDITTFIDDSQGTLKGAFNYATNLFRQETISQMIKTFEHILGQIA